MKYLLQMIVDEASWQNLSPEEMQPMLDEIERYNDSLRQGGVWVSAEGLDFSTNAKTVRVREGERTVTDGPYGSGKEQFGGFWIIEAESMDDAVSWAKQVPMTNGSTEVRELVPEE
ncbi:MAG: YciI family protein [Chloroflexota bacterium]|nr:YciI family protein [Chloroflexota bacterium]